MDLLHLSNDILAKIFLHIPDIGNKNYRLTNKRFKDVVEYLIESYNKKFSYYSRNWKYDRSFTKKFFSLNFDNDDAIFLFNNVAQEKSYIIYRIARDANINLLMLLDIKKYCNAVAEGAARGGHLYLVKYAVFLGARNFNTIAREAAYGKHYGIIDYAVELGAKNYFDVDAILNKTYKKHKVFPRKRLGYNISDYNEFAKRAAINGNLDKVKYAIRMSADNFIVIALKAAKYGYLYILKYIYYLIGKKFNFTFRSAKRQRNDPNQPKIISTYRNAFYDIAERAAIYGHLHIIKYLVGIGVDNYQCMAECAASNGFIYIVEYLVGLGACNYVRIGAFGRVYRHDIIFYYAINLGANKEDIDRECQYILNCKKRDAEIREVLDYVDILKCTIYGD